MKCADVVSEPTCFWLDLFVLFHYIYLVPCIVLLRGESCLLMLPLIHCFGYIFSVLSQFPLCISTLSIFTSVCVWDFGALLFIMLLLVIGFMCVNDWPLSCPYIEWAGMRPSFCTEESPTWTKILALKHIFSLSVHPCKLSNMKLQVFVNPDPGVPFFCVF